MGIFGKVVFLRIVPLVAIFLYAGEIIAGQVYGGKLVLNIFICLVSISILIFTRKV